MGRSETHPRISFTAHEEDRVKRTREGEKQATPYDDERPLKRCKSDGDAKRVKEGGIRRELRKKTVAMIEHGDHSWSKAVKSKEWEEERQSPDSITAYTQGIPAPLSSLYKPDDAPSSSWSRQTVTTLPTSPTPLHTEDVGDDYEDIPDSQADPGEIPDSQLESKTVTVASHPYDNDLAETEQHRNALLAHQFRRSSEFPSRSSSTTSAIPFTDGVKRLEPPAITQQLTKDDVGSDSEDLPDSQAEPGTKAPERTGEISDSAIELELPLRGQFLEDVEGHEAVEAGRRAPSTESIMASTSMQKAPSISSGVEAVEGDEIALGCEGKGVEAESKTDVEIIMDVDGTSEIGNNNGRHKFAEDPESERIAPGDHGSRRTSSQSGTPALTEADGTVLANSRHTAEAVSAAVQSNSKNDARTLTESEPELTTIELVRTNSHSNDHGSGTPRALQDRSNRPPGTSSNRQSKHPSPHPSATTQMSREASILPQRTSSATSTKSSTSYSTSSVNRPQPGPSSLASSVTSKSDQPPSLSTPKPSERGANNRKPLFGGLQLLSQKARLPFRSPLVARPPSSEAHLSTPISKSTETPSEPRATSSSSSSTLPPSLSSTPSYKPPSKPYTSKPFRSPLVGPNSPRPSSSKGTPSSIAVQSEIKKLEGRLISLKQALKIVEADKRAKEEGEGGVLGDQGLMKAGGDDSNATLSRLIAKWKEAGKAAAEMLWDLSKDSSTGGPSNAQAQSFGGGGGGWSSSWGFGSTSTSDYASGFGGSFDKSWGWAEENPQQDRDAELEALIGGRDRGENDMRLTEEEKIRMIEKDLEENPPMEPSEFLDEMVKAVGGGRRRKGDDNEEDNGSYYDNDSESQDFRGRNGNDLTDIDGEWAESPSVKWNVVSMMRMANVDPGLFDWNDAEEDFVDK